MKWLDTILAENKNFRQSVSQEALPTERELCPYAVITCMDPRVNLSSIGVLPFDTSGQIQSQVRIIRTLGGIAESRSLVVGIHLAGFKEIAVLMHSDCGCSVAYSKIDKMIENLESNLTPTKLEKFKKEIGVPFRENLIDWLGAFEDPKNAVIKEVMALKQNSFIPDGLIIHGLVYDLSSGGIEVVINGYTT
ncbi:MAG: hypothetical protein MJB14_05270 [Spirochaetes bacterium]|nr:hypothetical protein [Spirochaetota bacterium]